MHFQHSIGGEIFQVLLIVSDLRAERKSEGPSP
jgi:hypothetical protein